MWNIMVSDQKHKHSQGCHKEETSYTYVHRYYIIMASFIIYKLYICDICIIATFLSLQTCSAKNEHFVDTYIIAVRRVEWNHLSSN